MRVMLNLAALALTTSPAFAGPCKDAKGRFIKCQEAKAKPAARCKNAKGKFTKWGTAGGKPV